MNETDNVRSVSIGSDHGAYSQKEMLRRYLEQLGYRVVDVGCHSAEKVDYPDIAAAVCRKVVSGDCERGIVLDGAGIGSCMGSGPPCAMTCGP
jgi:ribose 5-phosphate isomerase B